MRLSSVYVLALTCVLVTSISAHDVITTKLTYSREISRMFEKRCVSCHGGVASIPLTSYQQVRPWAVDIKEQVLKRQMPPWGAVKGFGDLSRDPGLTQEELLIIAAWVIGGAPEGNPTSLPLATPLRKLAALPPLHDGILVHQSRRLNSSMVLAGIRPDTSVVVPTARITVRLPDGRKQPLVWLFDFDPQWKQVFRLREPLPLPAGSVVESDVPVQFALETQ